jgi:hypothetical protein
VPNLPPTRTYSTLLFSNFVEEKKHKEYVLHSRTLCQWLLQRKKTLEKRMNEEIGKERKKRNKKIGV